MDLRRKRALRYSVYGTLGFCVLLVFLNAYTRQTLIGPTVRGEPFCAWQQRFREGCAGTRPNTWVTTVTGWIGFKSGPPEQWPGFAAPDLLPVLLSLVDDPNPDVRAALAIRLGWYPLSAETGDALMALLDDPAAPVRANAVQTLGFAMRSFRRLEHLYQAGMPKLRGLMDDEDDICRVRAAGLVCKLSEPRDERAYRILLAGLDSPWRQARQDAAAGLCAVAKDCPDSFAELAAAARNDPDVRGEFVPSAFQFGPVAIPVLAEFLDDGDRRVRIGAASSLGEIGAETKVPPAALFRALQDSDVTVRNVAYDALSRIDPERYPPKDAP
jgi:HEAT repeat protein